MTIALQLYSSRSGQQFSILGLLSRLETRRTKESDALVCVLSLLVLVDLGLLPQRVDANHHSIRRRIFVMRIITLLSASFTKLLNFTAYQESQPTLTHISESSIARKIEQDN